MPERPPREPPALGAPSISEGFFATGPRDDPGAGDARRIARERPAGEHPLPKGRVAAFVLGVVAGLTAFVLGVLAVAVLFRRVPGALPSGLALGAAAALLAWFAHALVRLAARPPR